MTGGVNGKTSILLPDLAAQSDQNSASKKAASGGRLAERRGPGLLRPGEQADDSNLVDIESEDQRDWVRGSKAGAAAAAASNDQRSDRGGAKNLGDQLHGSASVRGENHSARQSAGTGAAGRGQAEGSSPEPPQPKPAPKPALCVDLSPKVRRQFKIYSITGRPPVQSPCSRDTEWQQVLQLFSQRLNMASF